MFARRVILPTLLLALGLAGCSRPCRSASSSAGATSGGEVATGASHEAAPPATPTAFVERLLAIARGEAPGSLEAHVDAAFAERLPSEDGLERLLRGYDPARCRLEEGPGYGAVAIPPPFDDQPEEEIAETEAIIEILQASTEVLASCTETQVYQEEVDEEPTEHVENVMLFAIAVARGEDGTFRALAWRGFDEDEAHF